MEKKFIWDGSLNTGIHGIDEQHRILISIYNDVVDALEKKSISDPQTEMLVASTLSDLIAYSKYHFSSEEYLLELANYPQLKEHLNEHEKLRQKLTHFHTKHVIRGEPISYEILDFFRDWIVNHIGHSDMEYATIVRRQLPLGHFAAK